MKPVAILLALASTACTVSAGLPRYAKCTADSQCNSNYCAPMRHADCDEVVNCRGGRCYDCRDPSNLARARPPYLSIGSNVQGNMQCIDNAVIMDMGGQGPFPVEN
ncbi:hypothetical protein DER46DRAFT_571989 [Fusarium sp. MPI-SDFR-AT-0072]|nr:hypothetical protein DER46DRAFT_571989 [Fusarium sp. MPI-SDFR-AT-0072]